MRRDVKWCGIATISGAIILAAGIGSAIGPSQYDDFEDGTVMSWQEGGASPNPPFNVAAGGPNGDGDNFLRNDSSGGGGPGSKMVMFNNAQWTGDYFSLGSPAILQADMANLGTNPLEMRVALESDTFGGTRYCSAASTLLPPDGQWYTLQFQLTDLDMVVVGGGANLEDVMKDVTEVRILHASFPDWQGGAVFATLGVDNIAIVLPIFGDGFESEDTSAWSLTVP